MNRKNLAIAISFGAVCAYAAAVTVKTFLQSQNIAELSSQYDSQALEIEKLNQEILGLKQKAERAIKRPTRPVAVAKPQPAHSPPPRRTKPKPRVRSTSKFTNNSMPIKKVGGTVYVNRSFKDQILGQDFNQTIQSAKVIPQVKDGAIEGFKFVTIRQNSAFKKLGFSQGDVITAVNGNPLSSPAEAIKLFNVLKNAKRFQVQLTRGGQASSMNYQVD